MARLGGGLAVQAGALALERTSRGRNLNRATAAFVQGVEQGARTVEEEQVQQDIADALAELRDVAARSMLEPYRFHLLMGVVNGIGRSTVENFMLPASLFEGLIAILSSLDDPTLARQMRAAGAALVESNILALTRIAEEDSELAQSQMLGEFIAPLLLEIVVALATGGLSRLRGAATSIQRIGRNIADNLRSRASSNNRLGSFVDELQQSPALGPHRQGQPQPESPNSNGSPILDETLEHDQHARRQQRLNEAIDQSEQQRTTPGAANSGQGNRPQSARHAQSRPNVSRPQRVAQRIRIRNVEQVRRLRGHGLLRGRSSDIPTDVTRQVARENADILTQNASEVAIDDSRFLDNLLQGTNGITHGGREWHRIAQDQGRQLNQLFEQHDIAITVHTERYIERATAGERASRLDLAQEFENGDVFVVDYKTTNRGALAQGVIREPSGEMARHREALQSSRRGGFGRRATGQDSRSWVHDVIRALRGRGTLTPQQQQALNFLESRQNQGLGRRYQERSIDAEDAAIDQLEQ